MIFYATEFCFVAFSLYLCIVIITNKMKKYELTSETKVINGVELHRIKALESFGNIKEGELGGWIEREENLSQYGDAWVGGNAMVRENAVVFNNACVHGNAKVRGNAIICGNATVFGDAVVRENATVFGDAKVRGNAIIYENAKVFGDAKIRGNAIICGNAEVYENAEVGGNAIICGNAKAYGNAKVCGNAWVCGNAKVCETADYIVFKNWWSSGRYFTWTRSNNKWKVGCFMGTGEELIAKAYKDSEKSGREYERVVKYVNDILKEEDNDNGNRNKCED